MNDDFSSITTVEDAKTTALVWAREAGTDTISAGKFAETWFAETELKYRVKSNLIWMLAAFDKYKRDYDNAWAQAFNVYLRENSQWHIEITRHLAAFNTAGIAGTAAMLARSEERRVGKECVSTGRSRGA